MGDRMPFGRRDSDAGADWGPEEDDLVRRALQSLREDVDASVLPGPKAARDEGNRRRRARWTVAGFGLAAAGVAIAAVGLSGVLRPGHSLTDPATGASRSVTSGLATSGPATSGPATSGPATSGPVSPTGASSNPPASSSHPSASGGTSTSPGTAVDWAALLDERAILPTAAEWQAVLGRSTRPSVVDGPAGVGDLLCATSPAPGVTETAQEVTVDALAGPLAKQADFVFASEAAAAKAATAMSATLSACPLPKPEKITPQSTDRYSSHPVMWSFADSDGNTGWVTITQRGRDVAYVETWASAGSTTTPLTLDQFARLTSVVENRLERYGAAPSPTPGTDRHLAGPAGHLPAPDLFLDPADFTSVLVTGTGGAEAGPGQWEGGSSVTTACDADTAHDGTFALMAITKAGVDAGYFATQRIRQVSAGSVDIGEATKAEVDRLAGAFSGCDVSGAVTHTTSLAGPASGLWKLETTFTDGTAPFIQFVAVGATGTPGYVSTIVLTAPAGGSIDEAGYWRELERLQGLAAQR